MDSRRIIQCGTCFLLILICTLAGRAQGRFGFGIVVGEPTGLAWKYRMDQTRSVAGTLGVLPSDRLRVNVDVLWHSYFRGNSDFAVHYGPGIFVGAGHRRYTQFSDGSYVTFDNEATVGVRMAIGVTYLIPRSPVDLFFEVAPAFILANPAGFVVDYGLGARVYP